MKLADTILYCILRYFLEVSYTVKTAIWWRLLFGWSVFGFRVCYCVHGKVSSRKFILFLAFSVLCGQVFLCKTSLLAWTSAVTLSLISSYLQLELSAIDLWSSTYRSKYLFTVKFCLMVVFPLVLSLPFKVDWLLALLGDTKKLLDNLDLISALRRLLFL